MWVVPVKDNAVSGAPFKTARFATSEQAMAVGLYPCNYGGFDAASHYVAGSSVGPDSVTFDIQPLPALDLLASYKQDAIKRIEDSFTASLSAGYECNNGITMDAPLQHVSTLQMGVELAKRTGAGEMYIVDFFNAKHEGVPVAEVDAMLLELGCNFAAHHEKKNDLRLAIQAAATISAVDAVVW